MRGDHLFNLVHPAPLKLLVIELLGLEVHELRRLRADEHHPRFFDSSTGECVSALLTTCGTPPRSKILLALCVLLE